MTHEVAAELMDRWFRGDSSASDWDRLAPHLRECADCRKRYQSRRGDLLEAESRDAADPDLTQRELDMAATLALERIASDAGIAASAVPPPALAQRTSPRRHRAAKAGMAIGATALFFAVLYHAGAGRLDGNQGLRSLGSDDSAFGLQVICFQRDNPNQYLALRQSGRCSTGSYVKLQVSSLDPTVREVSAVALSDDLTPLRVFQATLADTRPVTLSGYVELTEHRRIGVAFVFSSKPLSEATLRAGVERAAKQGQTLTGLRAVPLAGAATQRLLLIEAEDGP